MRGIKFRMLKSVCRYNIIYKNLCANKDNTTPHCYAEYCPIWKDTVYIGSDKEPVLKVKVKSGVVHRVDDIFSACGVYLFKCGARESYNAPTTNKATTCKNCLKVIKSEKIKPREITK